MYHQTTPVQGFMDGFMNPQSALYLIGFMLLLACAGTIIGLLTRNIAILIGIAGIVFAIMMYHHHLPLPDQAHIQINALKNKVGL